MMIATLMLGAALTFGTFGNDPPVIGECDIVGYPVRQTFTQGTRCCIGANPPWGQNCYHANYGQGNVCAVADESKRCCVMTAMGAEEEHGGYVAIHCLAVPKSQCVAVPDDPARPRWCGAPAPPADEKLSSGAIGGIVVGAYLGVAAIGGAVAAYRV